MSRQAVFAHSGNVPDVGHDKLSVKRLSWMGAHKTESVIVTYEDPNRLAQADEARKQREKIMNNIRTQLNRINEMLESPEREKNNNKNSTRAIENGEVPSPTSAMGSARARHADPKQLVSYLDGTTHSRFSIANYNSYVRTKMIEIMEAHPPNSEWPVLPTDEDFHVPPISEGTGVSPSNVTSAPTWRDMLGGRGTIGYNTKASACAKELLQYEFFKGVNFADGFNDKASSTASPQNTETARATAAGGDETARPVSVEAEKKPQQQQEQQQQQQQQQQAAAPTVVVEEKKETPAEQQPVAPPAIPTATVAAEEKKPEQQQPVVVEDKKEEQPQQQQQPAASETTTTVVVDQKEI